MLQIAAQPALERLRRTTRALAVNQGIQLGVAQAALLAEGLQQRNRPFEIEQLSRQAPGVLTRLAIFANL